MQSNPRGSGNGGIGNMVLVPDADHSRVLWRTGVVKKLISGQDGVTRGAIVRLSSAKAPVTLRRTLQLLYPLETCAQGQASSAAVTDVASDVNVSNCTEPKVRERRRQPREASRLA